MKHFNKHLLRNAAYLFLLAILTLSLCFLHLDTNSHLLVNRKAYQQFLHKASLPFKNLRNVEANETGKADSPEMAALQEYFMTMDPVEKRVPAERLMKAYQDLHEMQSTQLKSSGYQLQWTSTGAEMGGRTRAIMWDPTVANKVWAGGVTGGLWYNNDITSASTSKSSSLL